MTKKLRKMLYKILGAAVFFAAAFLPIPQFAKLVCFAVSYFIVGLPIVKKAANNIKNGEVFDENFLMTIATFGAVALGEYPEAVAVMLFFQVGEFFQSYAVNRSRKSIAALMDIHPDFARVQKNGALIEVSPEKVKKGEIIEIRSGEKVPLDGVVVDGISSLDTSSLTGEALPKEVKKGDIILSGAINLDGVLKVKTTSVYAESTAAKILDLVENASSKKAEVENFITKFARWYTPLVVVIAVFLACVPPCFLGQSWQVWVYRAITFLVISCPCALVISVPLSFFGGIGAASKCGVLIKGSNYLEALAQTETVVFDKTGTLTKGVFAVTEIVPENSISAAELLEIAAYLEAYSSHPIAISIKKAYGKEPNLKRVSKVKNFLGKGICGNLDNDEVVLGNEKMLRDRGINVPKVRADGTVVYVLKNGVYQGYLRIEDEIKQDAVLAINRLKNLGISQTVMLTGDRKNTAKNVAQKLKLDNFYAELLPADKVHKFEKMLASKTQKGKVLFVGDGINDAPVLARSDIGIAMGGVGSDAAIEAADAVIMTDEPSKIAKAIEISQKTLRLVHENVVFILAVKFAVLGLGAAGYASIWAAVFADVGVSVISILNAMRALRFYK